MRLRCDDRDPKLDVAVNREASNPESLSETPERLSETKTRSGSPAAAAKKRAAEVLHFLHKLEQLDCMTDVIPNDLKSPGEATVSTITTRTSF